MMKRPVVIASARTPIGRAFRGSFADTRPEELAVSAIQAALTQVPEVAASDIQDLILGCGAPSGFQGNNLARIVAVLLGLDSVPGHVVSRFCSSSLQSIASAAHAIEAGEGPVFIAAGVESISSSAHINADVLPGAHSPAFDRAQERTRNRIEKGLPWSDPRLTNELPDIYIGMGETAEIVARQFGISREAQDEFACRSQARARAADARGVWAREITPIHTADGMRVTRDDSPRPTTTIEGLAQLAPVFRADGSVTAGNSCPLNDGAAALVIADEAYARERGITPIARVLGTSAAALGPEVMGLGPIPAIRKLWERTGLTAQSVDLFEINEAFAAQVIACARELELDEERLNVHGGAIALGHPYGMTGARIAHTMINALQDRDETLGVESMCVAGGQGMALALERL